MGIAVTSTAMASGAASALIIFGMVPTISTCAGTLGSGTAASAATTFFTGESVSGIGAALASGRYIDIVRGSLGSAGVPASASLVGWGIAIASVDDTDACPVGVGVGIGDAVGNPDGMIVDGTGVSDGIAITI